MEALAKVPSSSLQNRCRRPGSRTNHRQTDLRRASLHRSSRDEEERSSTDPKSHSDRRSMELLPYLGHWADSPVPEMLQRASWFLQ